MSLVPFLFDERPFGGRLMRDLLSSDDFLPNYCPFRTRRDVPVLISQQFRHPLERMFRTWENVLGPMEQLSSQLNQMALKDASSKFTSDDEKFQINVDVQHFLPEEISVKVMDGHVVVQGKHEEKMDQHGYISRQFVRRYALPQGCLPDTVESKLSSDGVLTVTAPKVLAMPSIGERIVPITPTGPVQKQLGSPDFEAKESK